MLPCCQLLQIRSACGGDSWAFPGHTAPVLAELGPTSTVWLLHSRWSQLVAQTLRIQAIWNHTGGKQQWQLQVESDLSGDTLARCTVRT